MEFLYGQILWLSGLGHSRRRLAGIPLPVMEFLCADTYISLLDLYWISTGSLLELYWVSIGSILDLHWISTGHLLDLYWISIGLMPTGALSVFIESLLGLYWISIGSLLDL